MNLFVITPDMGKRLIARGIAGRPDVQAGLKKGMLVIVAGTTNGYVAQEILTSLGQLEGFSRDGFCRGMTRPPGLPGVDAAGRTAGMKFHGDVVIVDGLWQKGKEIFDVVGDMQAGDVIIKGANAVNLASRQAAVLIGHPQAGTIGAVMPAVAGRRVRLIVPVGLEKRVDGDLSTLSAQVNAPGSQGPRLLPLPGEIFTEIDALRLLTGAEAAIVAAGGVGGAEGAVWLGVSGTPEQLKAAGGIIASAAGD